MQYIKYIVFVFICFGTICESNQSKNEFTAKLKGASNIAETIIQSIYNEWKIDKYPKFLKSCFMHKSSWELMKLKFMYVILSAEETQQSKDFIISFLGRYV